MAIQATTTLNSGDELVDAYIRISDYRGQKEVAEYMVEVYESQEARDEEISPLELRFYGFEYDMDSTDGFLVQAYTALSAEDNMTNQTNV